VELPDADAIAEMFGMEFESEAERIEFNAEVMERVAEIEATLHPGGAGADSAGHDPESTPSE
jgi:hypothetical protein